MGVRYGGCVNPLLPGRFGPVTPGKPVVGAASCCCVRFGPDGEAPTEEACWPGVNVAARNTNVKTLADLLRKLIIVDCSPWPTTSSASSIITRKQGRFVRRPDWTEL